MTGKELRKVQKALGYESQEKFARALGYSLPHIQNQMGQLHVAKPLARAVDALADGKLKNKGGNTNGE